MQSKFALIISRFIHEDSAQGITEYGAILAFVAVLITVVAGFVNGSLQTTLSQSFSTVTSALNALNNAS